MDKNLIDKKIKCREEVSRKIKEGLIERLNLYQTPEQIDDDTPLFGSGLKLDSVDATEVILLLDEAFGIRVSEGEDPAYMRTINSLISFVISQMENHKEDSDVELNMPVDEGSK